MKKYLLNLCGIFLFLIISSPPLFAQDLTGKECADKVLLIFSPDFNKSSLDEKISYLESGCEKYFDLSSLIVGTAHLQFTASPAAYNMATKKRLIAAFEKIIGLHEKSLPDSGLSYHIAEMYLSLGVACYDEEQINQIDKSISYLTKFQTIVERLRSKNIKEKSYTNDNYNWCSQLLGAFEEVRNEHVSKRNTSKNCVVEDENSFNTTLDEIEGYYDIIVKEVSCTCNSNNYKIYFAFKNGTKENYYVLFVNGKEFYSEKSAMQGLAKVKKRIWDDCK